MSGKHVPSPASGSRESIANTTVEIQHDHGILYVYAADGKPLLKITGLPTSSMRSRQELKIHILTRDETRTEGLYTAALDRPHQTEAAIGSDPLIALRQAGATLKHGQS